ncbi:MAG: low molecular weight protein arginine phosphatase [Phycisphaerales bacterium]
MRTILFVCTGNTCRSPMAEALARAMVGDGRIEGAHEGGPDDEESGELFFASAGVSASDGVPTTIETINALERLKIEFSGRSKALTARMIRNADLVLCMTRAQRDAAAFLVYDDADAQSRILTLDEDADIPDPIGQSQDAYDQLAQRLQTLLQDRLSKLLQQ